MDEDQTITTAAYFEDIEYAIRDALSKAQKTVVVCVAWINWTRFGPLFAKLANNGVQVELMYNDDFINKKNYLEIPGVTSFPIRARSSALMHNKFCIVDGKTLITGSFNWSKRASWHFENIIISQNDFKLIKQFMHEYQDLKDYFCGYIHQQKQFCDFHFEQDKYCESDSYNLAILGQSEGKYDESRVSLWRICHRHQHVRRLDEIYIPHLLPQLGFDDHLYEEEGSDEIYSHEDMVRKYKKERRFINDLESFLSDLPYPIHAIGMLVELNSNEHLEWDYPLEHSIQMLWRETYHRKVIPSELLDEGNFDKIINWHRP